MDRFVAFSVNQASVTSMQAPICVMTSLVFVKPVLISIYSNHLDLCHEFGTWFY